MVRFLARGLLGTALVLALGLHWAVIQGVAWTGMLVRYSQEVPLSEAFSRTFDGDHPCSLCRMVAQGRSAERGTPLDADGASLRHVPRLEGLPSGPGVVPWWPPAGDPWRPRLVTLSPSGRDESPPVPPPRAGRPV